MDTACNALCDRRMAQPVTDVETTTIVVSADALASADPPVCAATGVPSDHTRTELRCPSSPERPSQILFLRGSGAVSGTSATHEQERTRPRLLDSGVQPPQDVVVDLVAVGLVEDLVAGLRIELEGQVLEAKLLIADDQHVDRLGERAGRVLIA